VTEVKENHDFDYGNMRYCIQKLLENNSPCPTCKSNILKMLGCKASINNDKRYVHVIYECINEHKFRKLLLEEFLIKEASMFVSRFGKYPLALFMRAITSAENIMICYRLYGMVQVIDQHPIDNEKCSLFIFYQLVQSIFECAGDHDDASLRPIFSWIGKNKNTLDAVKDLEFFEKLSDLHKEVRDGKYKMVYNFIRNQVSSHVGDINKVEQAIDASIMINDELMLSLTALDNKKYNASVMIGSSSLLFEKFLAENDININDFIRHTHDFVQHVPLYINNLFVTIIQLMPGAYKHTWSREYIKCFAYVIPEYEKIVDEFSQYS